MGETQIGAMVQFSEPFQTTRADLQPAFSLRSLVGYIIDNGLFFLTKRVEVDVFMLTEMQFSERFDLIDLFESSGDLGSFVCAFQVRAVDALDVGKNRVEFFE